jgi:hypothetical protein
MCDFVNIADVHLSILHEYVAQEIPVIGEVRCKLLYAGRRADLQQ